MRWVVGVLIDDLISITIRQIALADYPDEITPECQNSQLQSFLKKKVEEMIAKVKREQLERFPDIKSIPLPLIRLKVRSEVRVDHIDYSVCWFKSKVDYSGGFPSLSAQQFGQLFVNVRERGDVFTPLTISLPIVGG